MQTLSDVMDALGGVTAVSQMLSKPLGTVSAWKTRGSVPAEYWQGLLNGARQRGLTDITSDLLVQIHTPAIAPGAPNSSETAGEG